MSFVRSKRSKSTPAGVLDEEIKALEVGNDGRRSTAVETRVNKAYTIALLSDDQHPVETAFEVEVQSPSDKTAQTQKALDKTKGEIAGTLQAVARQGSSSKLVNNESQIDLAIKSGEAAAATFKKVSHKKSSGCWATFTNCLAALNCCRKSNDEQDAYRPVSPQGTIN